MAVLRARLLNSVPVACLFLALGLWICAAPAHAGEIVGALRGADGRPLANGVAFVTGVRAGRPPREPATMDQRRRTFIPHVLVVQTGTTILFPNNDTVYHNVFSYREGKRFNLGLYPVGKQPPPRVVFDEPGLVRVFCNIHSTMSAYIWVVDNPYFDRTGKDGRFRIQNVPPGSYTVQFWHPKKRSISRRLEVRRGETREDVMLPDS